jgi:acetyl esterase
VPLDPQIANLLNFMAQAGAPSMSAGTVEAARFGFHTSTAGIRDPATLAPVRSVEDVTVSGADGLRPARIYRPDVDGPVPTMVFFHGGGFVIGDIETHDDQARLICRDGAMVVVSIDYRLAPEHPFPAGFEDCLAATRWVADNIATLGGDAARLLVGGDSAGGNLSAVVCLMARDEGGPSPAMQLLLYPACDALGGQTSRETFAKGFLLTRNDMEWFEAHYLPDGCEHDDPRVSIMRAPDVANLPPAYVATSGFDPLRDEGETYAARMREAGVRVALQRYRDQIHGFANLTAICPSARAAMLEVAGALRMGLADPG